VSVVRRTEEKNKETRVHNARNAQTKQAKNDVKKGKNEFLPRCPRAITEESEKGDESEGCVALMGREVRLAAVPRVVMRN